MAAQVCTRRWGGAAVLPSPGVGTARRLADPDLLWLVAPRGIILKRTTWTPAGSRTTPRFRTTRASCLCCRRSKRPGLPALHTRTIIHVAGFQQYAARSRHSAEFAASLVVLLKSSTRCAAAGKRPAATSPRAAASPFSEARRRPQAGRNRGGARGGGCGGPSSSSVVSHFPVSRPTTVVLPRSAIFGMSNSRFTQKPGTE